MPDSASSRSAAASTSTPETASYEIAKQLPQAQSGTTGQSDSPAALFTTLPLTAPDAASAHLSDESIKLSQAREQLRRLAESS